MLFGTAILAMLKGADSFMKEPEAQATRVKKTSLRYQLELVVQVHKHPFIARFGNSVLAPTRTVGS